MHKYPSSLVCVEYEVSKHLLEVYYDNQNHHVVSYLACVLMMVLTYFKVTW